MSWTFPLYMHLYYVLYHTIPNTLRVDVLNAEVTFLGSY